MLSARRHRHIILWPLIVVLGAVSASSLAVLGAELAGHSLLWRPSAAENIAEAVLTESVGDVAWFTTRGVDLGRRWPVRPLYSGGHASDLTAIEATVVVRRLDLLIFLLEHGALVSEGDRAMLHCLALAARSQEIAALFEVATPSCGGVTLPAAFD